MRPKKWLNLGVRRTVKLDGVPIPGRGAVDEEAGGDVSEGVQPDHVVLREASVGEEGDEDDGEDHVEGGC